MCRSRSHMSSQSTFQLTCSICLHTECLLQRHTPCRFCWPGRTSGWGRNTPSRKAWLGPDMCSSQLHSSRSTSHGLYSICSRKGCLLMNHTPCRIVELLIHLNGHNTGHHRSTACHKHFYPRSRCVLALLQKALESHRWFRLHSTQNYRPHYKAAYHHRMRNVRRRKIGPKGSTQHRKLVQ